MGEELGLGVFGWMVGFFSGSGDENDGYSVFSI